MSAAAEPETFHANDHPHTRFNPLKGEWVLVSPHRAKRPWLGQIENLVEEDVPDFDPKNPLCPGVTRPCGVKNPKYTSTYAFNNDFPALLENTPAPPPSNEPLFQSAPAQGECRVLCYHPKSNVTIPLMTLEEVCDVIQLWISQWTELSKKWTWVQVFENRGSVMGCSNPHPHGQIWASNYLPHEVALKNVNQLKYYQTYNNPLLLDYAHQELEKKVRVVCSNDDWVVVVPYWALWPFETMLLPLTHLKRLSDVTGGKIQSLASIIKELLTRYDNLFNCSFPYTMGWHGAPTGEYAQQETTHWVLHAVFYPPLLRSATIKKFMVGYEMLCQGQRDITPEQAAERLRDLPAEHYLEARRSK